MEEAALQKFPFFHAPELMRWTLKSCHCLVHQKTDKINAVVNRLPLTTSALKKCVQIANDVLYDFSQVRHFMGRCLKLSRDEGRHGIRQVV